MQSQADQEKGKRRQAKHTQRTTPRHRKRPRRSTSTPASTAPREDAGAESSAASEHADSDPDFGTHSNTPSQASSSGGSELEVESEGELGNKHTGTLTVLYHGPSTEELAAAEARAKPPPG